MAIILGLDIGSNSVGSAWIDEQTGEITTATSIFPAGVDETDDKRGEPKNIKRRSTRRTRITLARRAARKKELKLELIRCGLLPADADSFKKLLDETDPWELRDRGLREKLLPHEFGRLMLHLAQRRGALGLKMNTATADDAAGDSQDDPDAAATEDGKVKAAIGEVRRKMKEMKILTFGQLVAMQRAARVNDITTPDRRPPAGRKGERVYRDAVRNKAGSYEHCADRTLIREEFALLWDFQKKQGGELASILTDALREKLDDETGDSVWRHKGLLFGQRRQTWDLGTLGRCVLEPSERCIAHADMYASHFRVAETLNALRVMEPGKADRPLTFEEHRKLRDYLRGPLGMETPARKRGQKEPPAPRPKRRVNVGDLRTQLGWSRRSEKSGIRFSIENDDKREINTDWFSREIVHGAVTLAKWQSFSPAQQEAVNRAILKHNPDEEGDDEKLKRWATAWGGLDEAQAEALVAAWRTRPRPESKRLNISRRAVRNLLTVMDPDKPLEHPQWPGHIRGITEIQARKAIAEDGTFRDVTTGQPLDEHARKRYATGARGASVSDRYYMRKHVLMKDGQPILDEQGKPLAEPPPAPLVSNPVVRKAIHEVRRHLVAHMTRFGRKPDEVYIELAREAKMGAKQADTLLYKNRLRNRIRQDIVEHFKLDSLSHSQQRVAVARVILAVQQGGICPLCGQSVGQGDAVAFGEGCELAHILPRASGGHNGLGNLVLAHTKCNRDMDRRTPRAFWNSTLAGGFDEGMRWVEGIYQEIARAKPAEIKKATNRALWVCYFNKFEDQRKISQFKRDIKDLQGEMTQGQKSATQYAARQVMAYLADALYEGGGLPERGGERKIFASDGLWTSRFRREWGLFFDPHGKRNSGLTEAQEHERKEKDRGDHRHHAIDAVAIALSSQSRRNAWDQREVRASVDGVNTADESQMDHYRRHNPLEVPVNFPSREAFRVAVQRAVFGEQGKGKPICHRPVKRKIIGALHEETLFGPVLDKQGNLTGLYTAKKGVLDLDSNHLRLPRLESEKEAVNRLALRRQALHGLDEKAARKWARQVVSSKAYTPRMVDPPPGKSGLVRDIALRKTIRACLEAQGIDPDDFSASDIKRICPMDKPSEWKLRMKSGVPIRSMVLLRTMADPVVVDRKRPKYETGEMVYDSNPASKRAYVGGNNHHIEIRVNEKGKWSGQVVSTFEVAQRKLARLRAFKKEGIPRPSAFRKLSKAERKKLHPTIAAIEQAHPMVDRRDDVELGGQFVMSLCEGETIYMRHKTTDEPDYFVVAKLDKPQNIVVVPHWDARTATPRKNDAGDKVADSSRDQFSVTPSDLKTLAPPGHEQAVKVHVDPLGHVEHLQGD